MLWTIRRKLLAVSLLAVTFLPAVGGTGLWGRRRRPPLPPASTTCRFSCRSSSTAIRASYGVRWRHLRGDRGHQDRRREVHHRGVRGLRRGVAVGTSGPRDRQPLPRVCGPRPSACAARRRTSSTWAARPPPRRSTTTTSRPEKAAAFDAAFDQIDTKLSAFQVQLNAAAVARPRSRPTPGARLERVLLLAALATAVVAMFLLASLISRSITRPINRCVTGLEQLAKRDLTATFGKPANDEVGRMVTRPDLGHRRHPHRPRRDRRAFQGRRRGLTRALRRRPAARGVRRGDRQPGPRRVQRCPYRQ